MCVLRQWISIWMDRVRSVSYCVKSLSLDTELAHNRLQS